MDSLLFEIAIAIIVAAAFGVLAKVLRQPLMIAYIIAGIVLGPIGFEVIKSKEAIDTLSTLGIAFLLFLVGIDLDLRKIKQFGKVSLILAALQLAFSGIVGFGIAHLLGFDTIYSFYIACALSFSSTVIGIKLISEKRALDSLYGRITIGLLIIQDIVAIILLLFIKNLGISEEIIPSLLRTFIIGILACAILFILSKYVIIPLFKYLGHSSELLFLASIAWCLAVAGAASLLGFSVEIGAFLAGLTLSILPAHFEISNKVRPLRDFFLTIFFISLGAAITLVSLEDNILPIIIFSALVLICIPAIIFFTLTVMGYTTRTSFMIGVTAGQISEFSLILIALGIKMGHLELEIISMIAIVAVITIGFSTFIATNANRVYRFLSPVLKKFEKKVKHPDQIEYSDKNLHDHFVVYGADRTGGPIVHYLMRTKQRMVVIDFDPELIKRLVKKKIPCLFGDASNDEIDDKVNLDKAKVIISTVPNVDINMELLRRVKEKGIKAVVIVTTSQSIDARNLYKAGANYVIVPHLLGGKYVAELLARYKNRLSDINRLRERHLKDLKLNGNGH